MSLESRMPFVYLFNNNTTQLRQRKRAKERSAETFMTVAVFAERKINGDYGISNLKHTHYIRCALLGNVAEYLCKPQRTQHPSSRLQGRSAPPACSS
jgi:hypothetical protein